MNNSTSNIEKNSKKQKKIKYIDIGIIFICIISLITIHKTNRIISYGHNGYTAKKGETLKVRENGEKFNIKVVSNIEVYNEKLLKLDVIIENKNNYNLQFLKLIVFSITDEKKSILIKSTSFTSFPNDINNIEIEPYKKVKTTIYFTEENIEDFNNYVKEKVLKKVKYLKIIVPSIPTRKKYDVSELIEDYYIEIN